MKASPMKIVAILSMIAVCTGLMAGCGNKGSVGDERAGAIFMSTSRPCLPNDGRSSAAITATVIDAAGYPVQIGTDLRFATTRGSFPNNSKIFSTEVIDWDGSTTVSLIAGFDVGWAEVEASANSIRQAIYIYIDNPANWPCECLGEGACEEEAAAEEEAEGGDTGTEPEANLIDRATIQTIELHADSPSAIANGIDSVLLTLKVQDASGQVVPIGTAVTLTTTQGQFANGQQSYTVVTSDETGIISTPLFSGTETGMATVYATYDGQSDMIAIGFSAP